MLHLADPLPLIVDYLRVLFGVLHELLHLLQTDIDQVSCGVLIIVILSVGDCEKLAASFFQEKGVDLLAVFKLFEVVLKITAKLFVTFVAGSSQHE